MLFIFWFGSLPVYFKLVLKTGLVLLIIYSSLELEKRCLNAFNDPWYRHMLGLVK